MSTYTPEGAVTWSYSRGRGTRNNPIRGGTIEAGDTWQSAMRELERRYYRGVRINELYVSKATGSEVQA